MIEPVLVRNDSHMSQVAKEDERAELHLVFGRGRFETCPQRARTGPLEFDPG